MKTNKGFAPIVIVLIVIAVLAIGGGAYYAGKSSSPVVPQNTSENNNQLPVNQNNTTNTSFSILSPKEGDQWMAGQTYSITLSDGILSDYHPLMQVFSVLDKQGKGVGAICLDYEMQKGARTLEWKAGTLMTACSGSGNSEIKMSTGEYQVLFTEFDSSGNKLRTAKSGLFDFVKAVVSTQPSVTVLSPNGGEAWAKGTTQIINWQDSDNAFPKSYDIKLVTVGDGSARNIANNIQGSLYKWTIQKCSSGNECSSNFSIPTGSYIVKVCQADTTNCDSSDNSFTIRP